MKNFDFIKLERNGGVATITLNRPEVYNALNDEITFELQDAFKTLRKDDHCRVIVLTGEGKAFCAGQDLKAATGEEKRSFSKSLHKRYNPLIRLIREIDNIVLIADEAALIEVFINIGLVPDSGSS